MSSCACVGPHQSVHAPGIYGSIEMCAQTSLGGALGQDSVGSRQKGLGRNLAFQSWRTCLAGSVSPSSSDFGVDTRERCVLAEVTLHRSNSFKPCTVVRLDR
jgi:hypothetical protein